MFTGNQRATKCTNALYVPDNEAATPKVINVCWATISKGPIPPIALGIDVARLEVEVKSRMANNKTPTELKCSSIPKE